MKKRLVVSIAGICALGASPASSATTSCSTVAACIFGTNTAAGVGVEGSSKTGSGIVGTSTSGSGLSGVSTTGHAVNGTAILGFGVVGTTQVNAYTAGAARAGVLGEDLSTNQGHLNAGVAGTSEFGSAVYGNSPHGGGISGVSQNGLGVQGSVINGLGVFGVATESGAGIEGFAPKAAYAIRGESVDGTEPTIIAETASTHGTLFAGAAASHGVFSIDSAGNEYLAGSLTYDGSSQVRTRSLTGRDVVSFGARTSSPALEDFGKAVLRNGSAFVALEPTFASTIDTRAGYMVFLTPEGNSHGLFATALSPSGFAVRENDGGRSSLTFDYRIVAHPIDTKETRLPAAVLPQALSHRIDLPKPQLPRIVNYSGRP